MLTPRSYLLPALDSLATMIRLPSKPYESYLMRDVRISRIAAVPSLCGSERAGSPKTVINGSMTREIYIKNKGRPKQGRDPTTTLFINLTQWRHRQTPTTCRNSSTPTSGRSSRRRRSLASRRSRPSSPCPAFTMCGTSAARRCDPASRIDLPS